MVVTVSTIITSSKDSLFPHSVLYWYVLHLSIVGQGHVVHSSGSNVDNFLVVQDGQVSWLFPGCDVLGKAKLGAIASSKYVDPTRGCLGNGCWKEFNGGSGRSAFLEAGRYKLGISNALRYKFVEKVCEFETFLFVC